MDETLSVRVPAELLRDLDRLSDLSKQARSELLREALRAGIDQKRLDLAMAQYRAGKVSLGRASAIAQVPLPVFLAACRRAGIVSSYDTDELRADVGWARLS